jgi:hypothetical protein
MAARTPRCSFASPFVITLAGALPALAACGESSPPPAAPVQTAQAEQHPMNPPRPTDPANDPRPEPTVIANPPRPQAEPATPPPPPTSPVVVANPPRPAPTPKHWNPPPPNTHPEPDDDAADRTWTVTRSNGTCLAQAPTHAAVKYECPPGLADGASLTVHQANDVCQIYAAMPPCPPKAMCNPPPPRKVACPK